jgi:hypothetical protein
MPLAKTLLVDPKPSTRSSPRCTTRSMMRWTARQSIRSSLLTSLMLPHACITRMANASNGKVQRERGVAQGTLTI